MSDSILRLLIPALGAYWNRIYSDRDLVRAKVLADDLEANQERRNFLEASDCIIRRLVPEFRRYGYVPIILTATEEGNAPGSILYVGQDPDANLGGQAPGSAYGEATVFHLNGPAIRKGYVGYPVYPEFAEVLEGLPFIQSALYAPEVVYVNGIDFFLENSVIYFKEEVNPFLNSDKFVARNIYSEDTQLLMWGAELHQATHNALAFIPIYEEIIQAFNESYYKTAMNALYDLSYAGPEKGYIKAAAAAVFGVPYCKDKEETVEVSEQGMVVTDKNVYTWETTAAPAVTMGQELAFGDPITDSVRVYWNVDFNKFQVWNDYSLSQFLGDVPIMRFDTGMIGDITGVYSIAAAYKDVDIIYVKKDANENPLFSFPLEVDSDIEQKYWTEVWTKYETNNQSMADDLAPYLFTDTFNVPGTVVGSVNQMKFYCDNFLKGNVYIISVDFGGLPSYINQVDGIGALNRVMPAHTRIFCYAKLPYQQDVLNPVWVDSVTPGQGNTMGDDNVTLAENNIKYRWIRV